ncbi:hypothetical protein FBU31_007763, partial [Coemansia sp. 'formosensis']
MLCSMPMALDVDEDKQEMVFVAVPSWFSPNQDNVVVTLPLQQLDSSGGSRRKVCTPATQTPPKATPRSVGLENRQSDASEDYPRCECLAANVDDA